MTSKSIAAHKGVAITPPVIGRISIGHVEVLPNGDEIPHMDDHFKVTTLVQRDDRSWESHPIEQKVLPAASDSTSDAERKLRSIPIRVAYNEPRLNVHSSFTCFDRNSGRVLCSSNGHAARRATESGVVTIVCPQPEACSFGARNRCQNMSRFYFHIEGQEDDLGVFVLRSTSWSSLKAIAGRIAAWHGALDGKIAGLPLSLVLVAKSAGPHVGEVIYFADLVQRPGMPMREAIAAAKSFQDERQEAGFSLEGMESALLAGLDNSVFAEQLEDPAEWLSDKDFVERAEEVVGRAQAGVRPMGIASLDKMMESVRQAVTAEVAGKAAVDDLPSPEVTPPVESPAVESPVGPVQSNLDLVTHLVVTEVEAVLPAVLPDEIAPTFSTAQPQAQPQPQLKPQLTGGTAAAAVSGESIVLPWTADDALVNG